MNLILFAAALLGLAAVTAAVVLIRDPATRWRRAAARRRAVEAKFQASVAEFAAELDSLDNPDGHARLRRALEIARREEDDR